MYRETISAIHLMNIVFQAIFNLLWQIGLMLLLAYLSVEKLGFPSWVYAPFVAVGAVGGIWSMIKFILSACRSLDALEEQHREDEKRKKEPSLKEDKDSDNE